MDFLTRLFQVSWKLSVQSEVRSASFHPSGAVVVIGTEDGHLLALDSDNGNHVTTVRVCGSPITAVPFNRDGDTIAAASQNGTIYLFKVQYEHLLKRTEFLKFCFRSIVMRQITKSTARWPAESEFCNLTGTCLEITFKPSTW